MPSDVHIHHSAHLQRAQPKLISPSNESDILDDITETNQTIYVQRYKALREAGFDEVTANKYSSMYSSVNEVIDAILSQSLADHLNLEETTSLRNKRTNNECSKESDQVLRPIGHYGLAFHRTLEPHSNNNKLTSGYNEKSSSASSSLNEQWDLEIPNGKTLMLNENNQSKFTSLNNPNCENFVDTNNDFNKGLSCLGNNTFFDSNVSEYKTARIGTNNDTQKLCERFGVDTFDTTNESLLRKAFNSSRPSDSFGGGAFFDDDLSFIHGGFDNNLLVTVLKDGIFESDEVILEDEGMVEPNITSSSPSTSSPLSSSGASSLLLDSSSSPSSLSSLSSLISLTPPNAHHGYESSSIESGLVDSLFGFPSKHEEISPNGAFISSKSKFASSLGNNDSIENNDLTRENVNKLDTLDRNHTSDMSNSASFCCSDGDKNVFNSFDKSFLGLSPEHSGLGLFSSKNSSLSQIDNFTYCDSSTKYQNENHLTQFGSLQTRGNSDILMENPSLLANTSNNLGDSFNKFPNQVSDVSSVRDSSFSDKNFSTDDSIDLMSYLNGRSASLFDYDQQIRSGLDSFGFGLDRINKDSCKGKNDIFGDFHYGIKSNLFMEDNSVFNAGQEADLYANSPYSSNFLNQQTFADITSTSNGVSTGIKSTIDPIGILSECKSPKSCQFSCPSHGLSNINSSNGYFNLFSNNTQNGLGQSSSFFELNNHVFGKKSFCSQPNYRSPLSPMSGSKFNGGSQIMNEPINFSSPMIRSNMSISSMLNTSVHGNGQQSGEVMVGGDGSLNKPTNLMAYKGLWVCNISPEVTLAYLKRRFRRFGHFSGIQTFERRATNGSNIVFVHYDNPYSPVEAISCLHNYSGLDLCADSSEPLKLRFAPSMEQSRAGQLPTLEQARKVVERHGECFNWRLSSGCHRGLRCQLKHVPINKEIDSQPWVKALKKKNND